MIHNSPPPRLRKKPNCFRGSSLESVEQRRRRRRRRRGREWAALSAHTRLTDGGEEDGSVSPWQSVSLYVCMSVCDFLMELSCFLPIGSRYQELRVSTPAAAATGTGPWRHRREGRTTDWLGPEDTSNTDWDRFHWWVLTLLTVQ